MGQKTDWGALTQDTIFNGVTGGAFEYLPGVPGRLPNLFSRAFFTGSHAQNALAQQFAGASAQLFSLSAVPLVNTSQLNAIKSTLQTISNILSSYSQQASTPSKSTNKI
jgi:hypothetical protein